MWLVYLCKIPLEKKCLLSLWWCVHTHAMSWFGANLLFKRPIESHIAGRQNMSLYHYFYVYVIKILHGTYIVYANLYPTFPFNDRISIYIINSFSFLNFIFSTIYPSPLLFILNCRVFKFSFNYKADLQVTLQVKL